MSSLTKVALVQMKMDAEPKKNLSKAIDKIKLAKKKRRTNCLFA
jgi:predicted amidohydrolase